MTIKIGDLVRLAPEDELMTCLKAYGQTGIVIEVDETIMPEMIHIMFSDQILSFYSDSVEVISHT